MGYRYENLTPLFKNHPDYDGHAVYGVVDEFTRITVATFVHRMSHGICLSDGTTAKSGGGIRWEEPDIFFDACVKDGMRLSRTMTTKFAALNVPLGGAKTVVFGCNIPGWTLDDKKHAVWPVEKRQEILRAIGSEIFPHTKTYVAAEDMGTTPADMAYLAKSSQRGIVAGCAQATNPSPTTARGLYMGVQAMANAVYGGIHIDLRGCSFAIQGVGSVGSAFLTMLWNNGVRNIRVADKYVDAIECATRGRPDIRVIHRDFIHMSDAEIYVPCARGGILNARTIADMHYRSNVHIIAGCANNQLETPADGYRLHEANIAYATDYVINAGGAAEVVCELTGQNMETMLEIIPKTLTSIFGASMKEDIPASVISDRMVATRVATLSLP